MVKLNPMSNEDEFGDIGVFSYERLVKFKAQAKVHQDVMCEIIKKSEMALVGTVEFLKCAEKNERAFKLEAESFIKAMALVEEESNRPKF